jgi:sec-independent protein translocase protein TatA
MFRNPTTDLIVVLLIVLLIFGPKRLPGLGKQLGTGLREFKDSITGDNNDDEDAERPAIGPAETSIPASAGTTTAPSSAAAPAATAERPSAEVGSEPGS